MRFFRDNYSFMKPTTSRKKLAVVDLIIAPDAKFLARLDREFQFILLLLPIEGYTGSGGGTKVARISDIESHKTELLGELRELFACGSNDGGPRAPGAACSFAAAADYSLYINGRFAHVLLRDLARLVDFQELSSIDLFSDKPRGGAAKLPLLSLARSLDIVCRVHVMREHRPGVKEWLRNFLPDPSQPWWQVLRERIRLTGVRPPSAQDLDDGSGKARIAMLVYHPKSVRHLIPVLEELVQAGHAVDFFSPRREVSDYLSGNQCASIPLVGALPTRKLAGQVAEFIQNLSLGTTAKEENERTVEHAFRQVLERLAFAELIVYSRCAQPLKDAFQTGGHKLAVGTDSGSTAGRCFFLTAERLGISTAFLQHGSFSVSPGNAPYFTKAHIYTWGDTSRQQLIDSGVEGPERITSIGSAFEEDHLNSLSQTESGSRPVILVAFGVPGNLVPERPFLAACREVISAAALHPGCDFLVKLHPGDKTAVWRGALQERGLANINISREDTYHLLGKSTALVTMFSTTGAEAIYLDKPVISVNLENFPATNDYLRLGAAYTAMEPGKLTAILAELLSNPGGPDRLAAARKEFANKLLYREAMPARKRIASTLEELALINQGSGCAC